jgi:hypothetical protein
MVRIFVRSVHEELAAERRAVFNFLEGDALLRRILTVLLFKDCRLAAYLLPALEAGLVEMTIRDKPTSCLQNYRLTAMGRAVLASNSRRGAP